MDVIYSYGPGFIVALLGILLIIAGITGGGIEISEIKIPKLDKTPRILIALLGLSLVMCGGLVGLLSVQQKITEQPTPMDMSNYVTRDAPTMDMSNYVTRPAATMDMSLNVSPVPAAANVAACSNQTDKGTLDKENKQVCMLGAYYPCLRWDEVTAEMRDAPICVRGIIRRIDATYEKRGWLVHWDFADGRTGFFALSNYAGWHPVTGKGMSAGDCVVITGKVQVLQNGRPYVFWGENSIFKAAVTGSAGYYDHPDLWVIEGDPSFCQ